MAAPLTPTGPATKASPMMLALMSAPGTPATQFLATLKSCSPIGVSVMMQAINTYSGRGVQE